MMKKTLLVFMVTLCIGFAHGQNMISNGNFETWTVADPLTALPEGWTRGAGTIGTHYLYATDATRGNVLRLTDPTSAASKRFSSDTQLNIPEAGTYTVSFWVKGTVRLRYVALVKGTASPANTASITNHYTTITGYTSGEVVEWTKVETDIVVPTTATFGSDYKLHIVWSNTTTSNVSDFLMDEVSLVKFVPSVSSKLSAITITPANYTTTNPPSDYNLGGFNSETYNYTFTSSYHNVPVIGAITEDPTATVQITQATSFTGTTAEKTATIVIIASDNSTSTYTVQLEKHPGFISGMTWDLSNITDRIEWDVINGLYFRSTGKDHGDVWALGNTSMRCNSTSGSGYYAITPVLTNGAGMMSLFVRNWDINSDNSPVVMYKSTNGVDWTEIYRVVPNTADWSSWKEVNINVNDASATLQIKIEFEKTITVSGQIYIDDVEILPWSPGTSSAHTPENIKDVFAANGRILFNQTEVQPYAVYNTSGVLLQSGMAYPDMSVPMDKGIYFVKLNDKIFKVAF